MFLGKYFSRPLHFWGNWFSTNYNRIFHLHIPNHRLVKWNLDRNRPMFSWGYYFSSLSTLFSLGLIGEIITKSMHKGEDGSTGIQKRRIMKIAIVSVVPHIEEVQPIRQYW